MGIKQRRNEPVEMLRFHTVNRKQEVMQKKFVEVGPRVGATHC